ncbi:hypothetical protein HD554DRAFT_2293245 [Boletus coccyginus]|nr:hypothetical protein HD554DRAFT_2293245 [Boletus coccyginus]
MTRRHGAMPNYALDLDRIPRAITWPTLRVLINVESHKTCKIFFPIFLKAVCRGELTAAGSSGEMVWQLRESELPKRNVAVCPTGNGFGGSRATWFSLIKKEIHVAKYAVRDGPDIPPAPDTPDALDPLDALDLLDPLDTPDRLQHCRNTRVRRRPWLTKVTLVGPAICLVAFATAGHMVFSAQKGRKMELTTAIRTGEISAAKDRQDSSLGRWPRVGERSAGDFKLREVEVAVLTNRHKLAQRHYPMCD